VQLPIFTAGRVEANIAANDARLDAASAEYDKAVLRALKDVENAYGTKYGLDRRAVAIATALSHARRNQRLRSGYTTAEPKPSGRSERATRRLRTRRRTHPDSNGQAAAAVQLYRALGGGS